MESILYIILAVFMFGVLIFIHEGGHYTAARIFGVSINEFSIGMGPKLLSRVSKKNGIRYSLRALPVGGFVSMVGEDEESDDPAAFCKKPVWQRMIITAAGAFMNIVLGILIMTVLVSSSPLLGGTTVAEFFDGATSAEYGLQVGDTIEKIGNTRVHVSTDLIYTIMHDAKDPVDVTVTRDGETVVLSGVQFPQTTEQGHIYGTHDFYVYANDKTVGEVFYQAFWQSYSTIKMIWQSLFDMIGGEYTVSDMSGPVGVTEAITTAAETGTYNLVYMMIFITINLGIFNLLPIPALDGGRLFFQFIELIFRKPVNAKIEGYIHAVGFAILMLLMVFVTFQDITKLIK